MLDEHDDAMAALRTWLALTEVARSTPRVAAAMAEVTEVERNLLVRHAVVSTERSLLTSFARAEGLAA
jgi:hypothetical protein